MTYFFKKISLIGIIYLFTAVGLQAQIAALQYRAVPQENIPEFLHRETTYWAEVAKKAIDDGKLVGWELWQRVGGMDLDEDSYNFVFINVFADKSGLDNMGSIWNTAEALPNVRIADLETNSLSSVVHSIIVDFESVVGVGGKFAKVNYAKVSDMEKYLAFETGVWQPLIEGLMKEKKTSFVGWNIATVLSPGGSSTPFDAFSVDHFDTLSEAIQTTWDEDIEFPDFTPYMATMDRVEVQVYGLVKKVYGDQ